MKLGNSTKVHFFPNRVGSLNGNPILPILNTKNMIYLGPKMGDRYKIQELQGLQLHHITTWLWLTGLAMGFSMAHRFIDRLPINTY